MGRLIIGILIGLIVGVPLGSVITLLNKPQQSEKVPSVKANQATKLSGGQNTPKSQGEGRSNPKPQLDEANSSPGIPAKWLPRVGESCTYEVPDAFEFNYGGQRLYLVSRDLSSLELMLKYIQARDGIGMGGLVESRRIFGSPEKILKVKILSINSAAGYAEVRMQSGNRYERDSDGQRVEGMLDQEAIIPLSLISQRKEK